MFSLAAGQATTGRYREIWRNRGVRLTLCQHLLSVQLRKLVSAGRYSKCEGQKNANKDMPPDVPPGASNHLNTRTSHYLVQVRPHVCSNKNLSPPIGLSRTLVSYQAVQLISNLPGRARTQPFASENEQRGGRGGAATAGDDSRMLCWGLRSER